MLRCADGSLYTGWTSDPGRRLRQHEAGSASRCTSARRPLKLVYLERCESKSAALRREAAIKRLKKTEKEALLERPSNEIRECPPDV